MNSGFNTNFKRIENDSALPESHTGKSPESLKRVTRG
jgi:hypothetical protein